MLKTSSIIYNIYSKTKEVKKTVLDETDLWVCVCVQRDTMGLSVAAGTKSSLPEMIYGPTM